MTQSIGRNRLLVNAKTLFIYIYATRSFPYASERPCEQSPAGRSPAVLVVNFCIGSIRNPHASALNGAHAVGVQDLFARAAVIRNDRDFGWGARKKRAAPQFRPTRVHGRRSQG